MRNYARCKRILPVGKCYDGILPQLVWTQGRCGCTQDVSQTKTNFLSPTNAGQDSLFGKGTFYQSMHMLPHKLNILY